ncbi:precorrin-3B synthase [Nakamurella leprariae]|uniref:Precorrin-3B synthase n=1 Tax=Nakamurella leprariae TaxID=2803911 RepID=A0A938Y8S2_9ACTN|nr:precorrin-3B synthase [Nakamurella leprariae]MBM9468121.1 precorrin-3B synthase [Nakamurella leprariae]
MPRPADDRCPGVLRAHTAVDGALVRVRIPGGAAPASVLATLSELAGRFADGRLQLTGRGNVQLRGLRSRDGSHPGDAAARAGVPDDLVAAVTDLGLLPSDRHERVRNIVTSPLTGRMGGLADLRGLARALDDALCDDDDLGALPGRVLFALDDGRGDVAGPRADFAVRSVAPDRVRMVLGGRWVGPERALASAVADLVAAARRFVAVRDGRWQVRELPGGGAELFDDQGSAPEPVRQLWTGAPGGPPALGLHDGDRAGGGRSLVVGAPLGLLTAGQVAALAAAAATGSGELIVTPWRSVVVPDLPADRADEAVRTLSAVGLGVDGDWPWSSLTACTGAPGCANALASTVDRARALAVAGRSPGGDQDGLPVHVVGCGRRCGAPAGPHVQWLAIIGGGWERTVLDGRPTAR